MIYSTFFLLLQQHFLAIIYFIQNIYQKNAKFDIRKDNIMSELDTFKQYEEILRTSSLFRSIPESSYKDLLEFLNAKIKFFKKDEFVLHLEDSVLYSGIVLDGILESSFLSEHFNKININHITKGCLFGESLACLKAKNSPIQLRALTDCCILFLDFSKLFGDNSVNSKYHHQLTINLIQDLSSQNLFLNLKVRILSQKGLRDRLHIYFSSLKPDENGYFNIPFSKTAFAEFLGVNRSALSRELSKMQSENLIEVEGKSIKLIS